MQDAPLVGDLGLLLGELANDVFELDVGERTKVGERVVHWSLSSCVLAPVAPTGSSAGQGAQYRLTGEAELEAARPSRTYRPRRHEREREAGVEQRFAERRKTDHREEQRAHHRGHREASGPVDAQLDAAMKP